ETTIVRRGVERRLDRLDGLLAGRLQRRLGLRVGRHLLPLGPQLANHLLELSALLIRLVLHARRILVEEGVAHLYADLVLCQRRPGGQPEHCQRNEANVLHASPSAHLPSSMRMIPEKSLAEWPLFTKRVNSWAALAP